MYYQVLKPIVILSDTEFIDSGYPGLMTPRIVFELKKSELIQVERKIHDFSVLKVGSFSSCFVSKNIFGEWLFDEKIRIMPI